MREIRIYNTEKQAKEVFAPLSANEVKMYVCGPTTYNLIHLGNARPVVAFDTIRRYFEYVGYKVTYIQNFTDVDDKIMNRAAEEKMEPLALAQKYIDEYFKDTQSLNIKPATHHPKVSETIPEIIDFIKELEEKGFAYELEGDVYYDIAKFADYGKLSGRNLEDMQMGSRVDVDQRKRHPGDFALWKSAKPGELSWDSPWGAGRPGWHIECSVMSRKYLGDQFDIHGGGQDLVFPHHENEVAQTEALTGKAMVTYWMHNGFITINKEKMSKSEGNFFLLREILETFDPVVVRFFLLETHYRSPLDFDYDRIEQSGRALERIKNTFTQLEKYSGPQQESKTQKSSQAEADTKADSGQPQSQTAGSTEPATATAATTAASSAELSETIAGLIKQTRETFHQAMSDDFNTALAIGGIFDFTKAINILLKEQQLSKNDAEQLLATYLELLNVLGLDIKRAFEAGAGQDDLTETLIGLLIELRQTAKKNKDFAMADQIRDQLKEAGVILEDTRAGVQWKISR